MCKYIYDLHNKFHSRITSGSILYIKILAKQKFARKTFLFYISYLNKWLMSFSDLLPCTT